MGDILGAVANSFPAFRLGVNIFKAVTGADSEPETPDDLIQAVKNMPPDERAKWDSAMEIELKQFEAETERRADAQGKMNPETLESIPPERRGKIAETRMTARPKIALMAARAIMLPVYMVFVDGSLILLNGAISLFFESYIFFNGNPHGMPIPQMQLLAEAFIENTLYLDLYRAGVVSFTAIVLGFMGLRQYDKNRQNNGDTSIKDMVGGLVKKFTK